MKNRIVIFQLLRAIAITIIFISHCEKLLYINDVNILKYLGGAGVSVFIALSGFLAAMKYNEPGNVSAIELYRRRWKQFYKNHLITLIIAVPLSLHILMNNPISWLFQLITNATLVQSLIPIPSVYFSFNAVSWYLSLMLFFALLTPLAVKLWNRMSITVSILLSIIVVSAEITLIYVGAELSCIHWLTYIFPAVRFLDFVVGGVLEDWKIYQGERVLWSQQIPILD